MRQAAGAGVLLVVAGGGAGALNLVFNVVVARGGGVGAYGAIGPLLMLGTVAGLLATGLGYGVARVVALAPMPAGKSLRMAFRAVLPWTLPTLILALLAVPIARFLHLASPSPVLIATVLAAVSVGGAAVSGLLIGLRRFRVIASLMLGSAILRLGLGFLLGHGHGAIVGSVLASALATIGSVVVGLVTLMRWPRSISGSPAASEVADSRAEHDGIGRTGLVGALIAGGLWGIWGLPLLFARHALPPVAAGDFAATELLAGGIIWITGPVVTAFYPTLVRHRHRSPIAVGAVATLGLSCFGVVGLTTVGPFLIGKLYGGQFEGSRELLLVLAISATVTSCATFASWTALARRRATRLTLTGLGLALLLELGIAEVAGHNKVILAAGPFLVLTVSAGLMAMAAIVIGRRKGAANPEDYEQSSPGVRSGPVPSER